MDKNTIREICDVVTDEIMKDIDQKLETTVHQIMANMQQLQAKVRALDENNQQLKMKIADLEKQISIMGSERTKSVPVQTTFYNGTTKPQQGIARAVDGITTLSADQMDDILSLPSFYREGNGWIYYIKVGSYDDEGELFKVRPDGTENQKIFSGNVWCSENSAKHDFKLQGNILSFQDAGFRKRTIKV